MPLKRWECRFSVPKFKKNSGSIPPDLPSLESVPLTFWDRLTPLMETHRGGWTLVHSFTSCKSGSNAVTPRPNWPARTANVPISTTPPLNESSLGAVLRLESLEEHWERVHGQVKHQPNGGSLVTKKDGSMSCQTACSGVAPYIIYWDTRGPTLDASPPTHNPCGKGPTKHKKRVGNPGGQVYLR